MVKDHHYVFSETEIKPIYFKKKSYYLNIVTVKFELKSQQPKNKKGKPRNVIFCIHLFAQTEWKYETFK